MTPTARRGEDGLGRQGTSLNAVWAMAIGFGATVVIGAVAGLYPAMRAARLSPTEALATP